MALQNEEMYGKLKGLSEMQIDTATGVNDIVDKFSDILYTAGNKSLRKKKVKNSKFKKI